MANFVTLRRNYGSQYDLVSDSRLYQNILETVGNTPLVKLNSIPKRHGLSCDIFAKCEFLNPAGSVKDRLGVAIVEDAKKVGAIKPNSEFVAPSSGNSGIGIALTAAIMDKKCTIVMHEKNSNEKVDALRLLGANVLKLKSGVTETVRKIKENNPDEVVLLNQFVNHVNPRVHYDSTGQEIINALDKVDMFVAGAGSGGTISGAGLKLKDHNPDCIVVAADPVGSITINPLNKRQPSLVEGVGAHDQRELIVMDPSVVDHVEVINDQESFLMARELAKTEGLLCGGSSGLAVAAAIKAAKALNIGAGKRVVVVLPDGIRNYMTKFVSDQWMEAHLFMDPPQRSMWWWKQPISLITLRHKYPKIHTKYTCTQALALMENVNIAAVINEKGHFIGAVTKDSLRNFATNPTKLPDTTTEEFDFNDPVTKHLVLGTYKLALNGEKGVPTIGLLSRVLDITPFVVIGYNGEENDSSYFIYKDIITGDEVLDYIHKRKNTKY
ncbi:cystathionine beta-synthase-like isoform X2 [Anticarsia gemmatalis]|uniref:cystathionine beta-synthase-like isoform X2 n=1 Tax=Anticarsia gemmatalis TaxID=129554 RepID=UPI003F76CE45